MKGSMKKLALAGAVALGVGVLAGPAAAMEEKEFTVVGTWGSGIQAWTGSGLVLGSTTAPNVIGAPAGELVLEGRDVGETVRHGGSG